MFPQDAEPRQAVCSPTHAGHCRARCHGRRASPAGRRTAFPDASWRFHSVEPRYPQLRWEVLAALKFAADRLSDGGRRDEARSFYRKIVAQFTPEASQVVQTVARGSRTKLDQGE